MRFLIPVTSSDLSDGVNSVHECTSAKLRVVHYFIPRWSGCVADIPLARVFQAKISYRLGRSILHETLDMLSVYSYK